MSATALRRGPITVLSGALTAAVTVDSGQSSFSSVRRAQSDGGEEGAEGERLGCPQCKKIGTQPSYFSLSKLASAERHPRRFLSCSTRWR